LSLSEDRIADAMKKKRFIAASGTSLLRSHQSQIVPAMADGIYEQMLLDRAR
jgi:hypothetical protein